MARVASADLPLLVCVRNWCLRFLLGELTRQTDIAVPGRVSPFPLHWGSLQLMLTLLIQNRIMTLTFMYT